MQYLIMLARKNDSFEILLVLKKFTNVEMFTISSIKNLTNKNTVYNGII